MDHSRNIANPMPLGFRLADVVETRTITTPNGSKWPAIPLKRIFRHDLTRTLWLAIKQWHITSQMFNHEVLKAAASIKRRPPKDAADLHFQIKALTGEHQEPDWFCEELLPYVRSVLERGDLRLEYREPSCPAVPDNRTTEKRSVLDQDVR